MSTEPEYREASVDRDSILVAEDDPLFRIIFQKWLQQWGYNVTVVENGEAAWRQIESEGCPRLLLLDWMMPDIDGVELCKRARALHSDLYTYILMVTSRQERRDIVIALDAGADDYVTKPVESNELRARLQVGRRILRLEHKLLQSRELLRLQATRDSLTGLLNHRSVLEALQEELARSARTATSLGILMLDLDYFKAVNDTYGHMAGDTVLVEVASRISGTVRSYDKVGRFGGEEFLVVLPDCSELMLRRVAERIRAHIAGMPVISEFANVDITVSIGGATAANRHTESGVLIRLADAALYSAKERGRNCCEVVSGRVASSGGDGMQPCHSLP
jgi:two-component system cell cycle response regulator